MGANVEGLKLRSGYALTPFQTLDILILIIVLQRGPIGPLSESAWQPVRGTLFNAKQGSRLDAN